MLEIIIMIAVVRAFYRTAVSKKLNGYAWGTIGALSFYIPVLIMGLGLLPMLVKNGTLEIHSQGQAIFMAFIFNAITGTVCCLTAWNILKRQKEGVVTEDNLLDVEVSKSEL